MAKHKTRRKSEASAEQIRASTTLSKKAEQIMAALSQPGFITVFIVLRCHSNNMTKHYLRRISPPKKAG